ncbi:MAG: hypothetical protein HY538_01300 [Deltaproteobacteria bacterium]|nr:hypothetical protein [Deltaproteobacteria bacterium]
MPQNEAPQDNRGRPDRRRKPTPFFSKYTLVGRRKNNRRGSDPRANYYVDRIGSRAWFYVVILVFLSFVDGGFTIYFLDHHDGFSEANPVMQIALVVGNEAFIFSKYALTIIGALVICLHKNFNYVRIVAFSLFGLYILLNSYHLYLYFNKI